VYWAFHGRESLVTPPVFLDSSVQERLCSFSFFLRKRVFNLHDFNSFILVHENIDLKQPFDVHKAIGTF
jgi:hypothetical protein